MDQEGLHHRGYAEALIADIQSNYYTQCSAVSYAASLSVGYNCLFLFKTVATYKLHVIVVSYKYCVLLTPSVQQLLPVPLALQPLFSNTSPSAQPNHSSLSVLSSVCHHFPGSLHTWINHQRGLVMTIIQCQSLKQNVIWSEKRFISGSHPSPHKPVL